VIGHMNRNGKERQEVCREIGDGTLDEGNPTTLGQIQHFPTAQVMLHLNHDIFPDRHSLVTRPKRHTKVLHGKRGSPAANSATLSALPIGTKRDLARLTFQLETTSKQNKRTRR